MRDSRITAVLARLRARLACIERKGRSRRRPHSALLALHSSGATACAPLDAPQAIGRADSGYRPRDATNRGKPGTAKPGIEAKPGTAIKARDFKKPTKHVSPAPLQPQPQAWDSSRKPGNARRLNVEFAGLRAASHDRHRAIRFRDFARTPQRATRRPTPSLKTASILMTLPCRARCGLAAALRRVRGFVSIVPGVKSRVELNHLRSLRVDFVASD